MCIVSKGKKKNSVLFEFNLLSISSFMQLRYVQCLSDVSELCPIWRDLLFVCIFWAFCSRDMKTYLDFSAVSL